MLGDLLSEEMNFRDNDPDAFDRHYFDIHMPMVRQLPGLLRAETGRLVNALDGGAQSFYRVAELYFPDEAAMDAGLASDAWKATATRGSQ